MTLRRDEIKIGHWWAPCCICDLSQVATAEDFEDARTCEPFSGAWATFDEAITELLSRRRYYRESDRQVDIDEAVARYGARVRALVEP